MPAPSQPPAKPLEQGPVEPTADLSRWWWPGQWLRIVYSVWFDQLWYWENVRPRLRGKKHGWDIFAQTVLGGLVIGLPMAMVTMRLLSTPDFIPNWLLAVLFFGATLGINLLTVWGLGLAHGVPGNAVLFPFAGPIFLWVYGFITPPQDTPIQLSVAEQLLLGIGSGVGIGWMYSLMESVIQGARWDWKKMVWESAWVSIIWGTSMGKEFTSGWVGMLTIGAGVLLGIAPAIWLANRWATRQVADEQARKRLAHPN